MARDEGFPVADVATGLFDDPKVRRLWRNLQDERAMAAAMALHEVILLTSWGEGKRITAQDAAPFWMADITAARQALIDVHLLDRSGRLPARSWNSWFGPALERRIGLRAKWRRANQRRKDDESRTETADVPPMYRDVTAATVPSLPYRPYRTVPSSPSRARGKEGLEAFHEVAERIGFRRNRDEEKG